MPIFQKSHYTTQVYINAHNSAFGQAFFLETFTIALSTHRANCAYKKLNMDEKIPNGLFSLLIYSLQPHASLNLEGGCINHPDKDVQLHHNSSFKSERLCFCTAGWWSRSHAYPNKLLVLPAVTQETMDTPYCNITNLLSIALISCFPMTCNVCTWHLMKFGYNTVHPIANFATTIPYPR